MRRVAITSDRFAAVASEYAGLGLDPVSLPCIEVVPVPPAEIAGAREAAARTELLIVTSPRLVSLLWPEGRMPPVDTAVVGPSTEATVTRAGGVVTLVGGAGLARLVELLEGRTAGRRVMIAHAEGSDPAAMSALRQLVPDLEEHVVYRSVPISPPAVPVDAVAFASPSAVTGWSLSRGFEDVVVGAIGSTTAAAVARHRQPDAVADQPSHRALATAIASFMEVNV